MKTRPPSSATLAAVLSSARSVCVHASAVVVAVAGAGAACAQGSSPADEIAVTAKSPHRTEAIRKLVETISRPVDGSLATYDEAPCVRVLGLAEGYDRVLADQMIYAVSLAGLTPMTAGCRPNLVLVIADDVRGKLAELAKSGRSGLDRVDLRKMMRVKGPAFVTAITQVRSSDGEVAMSAASAGLMRDAPVLKVRDASIISAVSHREVLGAIVLIEAKATIGRTLRQIADYAVLRGLARLSDDVPPTGERTILTLFDRSPPPGMTAFDRTYLSALYQGRPEIRAPERKREIAAAISRAVER